MDYIIKFMFVILISVFGLVMNMDLSTNARASKYLKEDLEIAVHDASMFQDMQKLAEGQFVYDKSKAEIAFRESFNENTGLSDKDYRILELKFLDHSNSTFPVHYQASSVKFDDIFTSPTIVAVIETTVRKYFTGGSEETVRRVASYSYKINLQPKGTPSLDVINGIVANENGLFWIVPFTRNITSHFDPFRNDPITGEVKAHNGMDIAAPNILGKSVVSAKNGKVIFSGWIKGYGNIVIVDHGEGFETRYAHLDSISVERGQEIAGGQILGTVGNTGHSTGPHLHFETRVNGVPYDPMVFY